MSYMTEANDIAAKLRRQPAPAGKPGRRAANGSAANRCRLPAAPTSRQLEVLAFMREFFAQNDQLPPAATISAHFGWSNPSACGDHIKALKRHGLIERNAVGKLRFARKEVAHG